MLKQRLLLPVCYLLTFNPSFILLKIKRLNIITHNIMALQCGRYAEGLSARGIGGSVQWRGILLGRREDPSGYTDRGVLLSA